MQETIKRNNSSLTFGSFTLCWLIVAISPLLMSCNPTIYESGHVSENQIVPALRFSDVDPANSGQIILVYSRNSVSGADYSTSYNKEHIFPKSIIQNGAIERDLYNIRPSSISDNNHRDNIGFVDMPIDTEYGKYDGGWYPGKEERGDVARAIMYMVKTYPQLSIDDVIDVNVALKWHREDPVDDFERNRNKVIKAIQKNTNPFVENPDLVESVFARPIQNAWLWCGISIFVIFGVFGYSLYKIYKTCIHEKISLIDKGQNHNE